MEVAQCAACSGFVDLPRFECCLEYFCKNCTIFCIECQNYMCPRCEWLPEQICLINVDPSACHNYMRPMCKPCITESTNKCACLIAFLEREVEPEPKSRCSTCKKYFFEGENYAEANRDIHCWCTMDYCEICGQMGDMDVEDEEVLGLCHCCRCTYCSQCADWKRFNFRERWTREIRTARVATRCWQDGSANDAYNLGKLVKDKFISKEQLQRLGPFGVNECVDGKSIVIQVKT